MRALELFAGAGGAALGLEAAGLDHAALVEWDAKACATLRAAGMGPVVEGDVREFDAIEEAVDGAAVDLLWSSFPCQAWSVAGSRKGASDDRNGWPWTVDALDRFDPTWFLGENVRGLTMHNRGCAYRDGALPLFGETPPEACAGCYLERRIMADLRARFAHAGWWLLDAADYGVPQHRRRIIIWAGPEPLTAPEPTHGPGRALPWASMGEALGIAPGARVVAAGVTGQGAPRDVRHAAPTIGAKGTALDRPAPTVTTTEEKGTRGPHMKGGPDRASDALWLTTGRRRLTPAECATLQAFPADHPWQGNKGDRYRQIGNAVPPPLAEVVGRIVAAQASRGRVR